MPHSGGGGSHSGGHHSGGHHSSSHGGSSSSVRVSNTPFTGCHTYAVYDRHGHSRLVYSDSSNYKAEITKGSMIGQVIFGSCFMVPGMIEFIIIIALLLSMFSIGVKKTSIPSNVNDSVYVYDTLDLISTQEEIALTGELMDFRDKTGIIPAVEFTDDATIFEDYVSAESYAYNQYVTRFSDEYHLLIVYSYGERNDSTGFEEFHWESMWGDDLSRTAKTSDEEWLTGQMQKNLTAANGEGVPTAIATTFNEFYDHLNEKGFRPDASLFMAILFLLLHGGIFFTVGLLLVLSSIRKYKESKEKGETTYKISGTPEILTCDYCGTTYYRGTIGNCKNCSAVLKN